MMRLCGVLPLAWMPVAYAVIMFVGLNMSCVMAMSRGHARVFLPMLSQCTDHPPEASIAFTTFAINVLGLLANIIGMALFMKDCKGWMCASFGLAAIVSWILSGATPEQSWTHEHLAQGGFFLYTFYVLAVTPLLVVGKVSTCDADKSVTAWNSSCTRGRSARLKVLLLVAGVATVVLYIVFMSFGQDGRPPVALCEWIACWLIVLFNLSYSLEYNWTAPDETSSLSETEDSESLE